MSQSRYDAWLVDLDGTLYNARWVRLAMALELALFGWASIAKLRRFRHEHETLREEFAAGTALAVEYSSPFAAQISRAAKALAIQPAQLESVVQDWMFVRPQKWIRRFPRSGLLAEVRQFKAAGGKTALVSDYPAEKKIRALGARELFDAVVASGEENGPRCLKPNPEGYLRAAQLLGVEPTRCLVIGDRDDADGGAARAANMGFRLVR